MANISDNSSLLGGIEAGGTKFNCVVANSSGDILARRVIPTTTPEQTLKACADFFHESQASLGRINALGIGSFGPVELDKNAPAYGSIKKTPKKGWSNTQVVGFFKDALGFPVAFETDVNAAAMGEYAAGVAQGCDSFVYVTIGTGIGAGVMIDGKLIQGIAHPEVGHMLIAPHPLDTPKISSCPFHDCCVEGLASGAALNLRFAEGVQWVKDDHVIWDIESHYLAVLCANLTQTYAPRKIVLGGGVMQREHLLPTIRKEFLRLVNGYAHEHVVAGVDDYIVAASASGLSGVIGALALAESVRQ
ncbi:MAG TPA: ROK family protein [Cellvibrio sp.]|nr:ROK family protein [Cellvibrio sp.]